MFTGKILYVFSVSSEVNEFLEGIGPFISMKHILPYGNDNYFQKI
uniref:Uncharacterized protein n=1 Tax=Arundo donax TaxID=35708 RepID=A0A0A8YFP0_ARUDO